MAGRLQLNYDIHYTKAADKFLREHEDVRTQYEDDIRSLLTEDHPEKVDVKRIKGKKNDYYRIRIGSYRVVYTIINGMIVVIIMLIAGNRGDVYKKISGLK
ncbi:MAG: type II toxin-antitoxin system RelE/ParE family toxin [Parasporobacterium sp.]|nr:type II toxin-antitoxin system RelE/ParE family toxin [Parasporobacterium sp.]